MEVEEKVMDFVVELYNILDMYDSIGIIVDRLSKSALFI